MRTDQETDIIHEESIPREAAGVLVGVWPGVVVGMLLLRQ